MPSITSRASPMLLLITILSMVHHAPNALAESLATDPVVARINGHNLHLTAYNHFLARARSSVIADISVRHPSLLVGAGLGSRTMDGIPINELVKREALAAATHYYALVVKAAALGLTSDQSEPFHGTNMQAMAKNPMPYGPATLSEAMIVSRYVDGLKHGIREKLLPDSSIAEEDLLSHYERHDALKLRKRVVAIRKIYMAYDAGTKAAQVQLMDDILRRLRVGEDFISLARQHSEDFRENAWVNFDAEGRQLVTARGPEDAFLKASFLDMKEGELRGVLDSGSGLYIARCEKAEGTEVSFAEARSAILQQLTALRMKALLDDLAAAAKVEINPDVYGAVSVSFSD